MRDPAKIPALGRVPPDLDTETRIFMGAVKDTIETREGVRGSDGLDRVVTFRDLVSLGLITESQVP